MLTDELVNRCRQGDQEAARQLVDAFVERLLPLARKRISQQLASRVDPEDIVQSAFRTFFVRLKEDKFEIQDQDDLYRLLVRITLNKTLRHIAHHKAAKRDPKHEVARGEHTRERLLQILATEPTPEDTVMFLDQLEHFMRRLRDEECVILEMRIQGYSTEEIAAQLGTYDRKIRRLLQRIRELAEVERILA